MGIGERSIVPGEKGGKQREELDYVPPPPAYETQIAGNSSGGSYTSRFACITFRNYDTIEFYGISFEDFKLMEASIPIWTRGLQKYSLNDGTHSLKLCGYPWQSFPSMGKEMIESKRFICNVLKVLSSIGWTIEVSCNPTVSGQDTILLKRASPLVMRTWFTLHWFNWDSVALIDAPPKLCTDLANRLSTSLQKSESLEAGSFLLKFKGYPFMSTEILKQSTKEVFFDIMNILDIYGFDVYASVRIGSTKSAADSWFCRSR